jgi:hypothetical protein
VIIDNANILLNIDKKEKNVQITGTRNANMFY